ncbi:MAG: 4-hydroxy-tetrahydrodipicolinate synthase [Nitrospinae bacterium]|nr:4-hydroxy-tetrahydrodipicolinate synthase [Nitrospinota bacterium]
MKRRAARLTGSIVAIVTPFRGGTVDEGALADLIDWQIEQGTDGIVVAGTTGESPTLSHAEHDRVIAFVVKKTTGRVPVIAGTGSNATDEAVRLTRHAADVGADGSLVVNPYYNRPPQEGLYRHFMAVADAADLPMLVYNIPGRTAGRVEHATLVRLAKHDRIVGVKDATGDLVGVSRLLADIPGFIVLSGDDLITLPMMALGATGVISVTANVAPAPMAALCRAANGGDFAAATAAHYRLLDLMTAMTVAVNPLPVKTALALMGRVAEEFRLPLCEMSPADRERVAAALKDAGLI